MPFPSRSFAGGENKQLLWSGSSTTIRPADLLVFLSALSADEPNENMYNCKRQRLALFMRIPVSRNRTLLMRYYLGSTGERSLNARDL